VTVLPFPEPLLPPTNPDPVRAALDVVLGASEAVVAALGVLLPLLTTYTPADLRDAASVAIGHDPAILERALKAAEILRGRT
jgi:hypothetical protein